MKNRLIYLDHNATTPPLPEVIESMSSVLQSGWGNPSSTHGLGRQARQLVEQSREAVAKALGAKSKQVIFTSGGSESNNWVMLALRQRKPQPHVVTTKVEHDSISRAASNIELLGGKLTLLSVDQHGLVDEGEYIKALETKPDLVSLVVGNNETGTLLPIKRLAALAAEHQVVIHCDASQCVGKIPVDFADWGVDLMTISAHKFYGPKGIGALLVREHSCLSKVFFGGGQEYGLRPGTENVAAVCGMAKAATLVASPDHWQKIEKVKQFRDKFEQGLLRSLDGCIVCGHPSERLPNTSNICFKGIDAQSLVMRLDLEGIACSAGSACHSGSVSPSSVLTAMGFSACEAASSVRFSFGRLTEKQDVDMTLKVLKEIVPKLRAS